MRRIAHDDKTTVKGRRHGITPNILKKEIAKPCKVKAPLRSVNQEIYRKPIYTKLLKTSGQHSIVSDKENHLVTQDVTRIFDKKTRSTVVSNDLSHYKFTRDNDLKKTLSHMEEKFTSSCEELQAAEEELVELRVALSDARRTIEILRMENARQAEKIKFLTIKKQKNDQSIKRYNVNPDLEVVQMNQEVSSVEHGSSKNLQRLVSELKGEKMALNLALENSKANESKIVLENNRLKMIIEEERKEWDQMQKDLLVAVKVANDFKIEAQKEMLKLSERITELQKRRQSAAFTVSQGSAITLYEKNFQSWEDKAWQRLMLGCERGSRRNTLLRWCQEAVVKFSHVEITNFSSSWTDGKALCSLLASFYPDKLSIDKISTLKAEECLELALSVGESMGVEVKVNVADFRKEDRPEWSLIMSCKGLIYTACITSVKQCFVQQGDTEHVTMKTTFARQQMIHSLLYEGIYRSLCYSVNPTDVAAYWAYLFFWSKVVELGDTLFIILKKKPLIFLHYYHHASVLIYTAHSGAENTGSGRAFIIMNFLVHSAMYTYFAITSYGIRLPKTISMMLTTIQIAQMFAGIGILAYIYKIKTETNLP
ncbi:unnamed protein product [Onchocerca ochengi]|uniref:Elongation of very long chain fatty acids protein n=1 Tax=Onchocerca ochengi TaxID=42157 RepID=A0A182DWN3_ONCOC|nr:unnamed protein product [Onchocerca ochengi]